MYLKILCCGFQAVVGLHVRLAPDLRHKRSDVVKNTQSFELTVNHACNTSGFGETKKVISSFKIIKGGTTVPQQNM